MNTLIFPDWPQPKNIASCSTTRTGGVSQPPFDSLNLGDHVGDVPNAVSENRQRLEKLAQLPQQPVWLEQVHGTLMCYILLGIKFTIGKRMQCIATRLAKFVPL